MQATCNREIAGLFLWEKYSIKFAYQTVVGTILLKISTFM